MRKAIEALEELRIRIAARSDVAQPECRECLVVSPAQDAIDLRFYGSPFDESYLELLSYLREPSISPWIRSLSLADPDEGSNGTKNWDLEPLVEHSPLFERLELLSVQLNQPAAHNRSIVGDMYEENGVIARVLQHSPRLRVLQVPSAPDATFFRAPGIVWST